MNKNLECKDHQTYANDPMPMTTKIFQNVEKNLYKESLIFHTSHIKNLSSDQHFNIFGTCVPNISKKSFGGNFLLLAQNISSFAVQLDHVRHAIFQLFQCYYYKKLFSEKCLTYACIRLFTSLIKVLKFLCISSSF